MGLSGQFLLNLESNVILRFQLETMCFEKLRNITFYMQATCKECNIIGIIKEWAILRKTGKTKYLLFMLFTPELQKLKVSLDSWVLFFLVLKFF